MSLGKCFLLVVIFFMFGILTGLAISQLQNVSIMNVSIVQVLIFVVNTIICFVSIYFVTRKHTQ